MVEGNDARKQDAITVFKVAKIPIVSPMAVENAVRNKVAQVQPIVKPTIVNRMVVENSVRNKVAQVQPLVKPTIV